MTIEELQAELETAKRDRDIWKERFEDIRRQKTDLMFQLFDAQERGRSVNIEPVLHENAQLKVMVATLQRDRDEWRDLAEVRGAILKDGTP